MTTVLLVHIHNKYMCKLEINLMWILSHETRHYDNTGYLVMRFYNQDTFSSSLEVNIPQFLLIPGSKDLTFHTKKNQHETTHVVPIYSFFWRELDFEGLNAKKTLKCVKYKRPFQRPQIV